MILQATVLGSGDVTEFELADVIGAYKDDDVLYVRSSLGETAVIYSSIKPVINEDGLVSFARDCRTYPAEPVMNFWNDHWQDVVAT